MAVDVNRLHTEGLYESRAPVAALTADLEQIQQLATAWHQARRRLAKGAALAFGVGVICFATGTLWFLGTVLFGLGGWFLYRMKNYPKTVANRGERCAFGKSLAAMIAADAAPEAMAVFRLAFTAQQETLSEGPLAGRKNGKEKLWKESWFSVEAGLCDGTTFSETIDDLFRQRSFTNARGKSKTKTRKQSIIAMRLDYPSEIYGDLTPFRDRMQKEIQLPPGSAVRALEVSGKAVKVKALSEPGTAESLAQASSMLALGVYRILNLSRQVEARKRAQTKPGGPQ
ncbi:MAG TPA: hypothetical protein VMH81_05670 [Bryobacteraceae bacterium]|nr:hypothetical protein [Bryobacteraceae bacterium]